MIEKTQVGELISEAKARVQEAEAIAANANATPEDWEKFEKLTGEVKRLQNKAAQLSDLSRTANELLSMEQAAPKPKATVAPGQFKAFGDFLKSVHAVTFKGGYDPRLSIWHEREEPNAPAKADGWVESRKDLIENVGASGGFLVPIEQIETLLSVPGPEAVVRPRATVVPMRRRQIQWPTLDQTNTTAGRPAWYGGVRAIWTEETESKTEVEPGFRQINLVAHKLVCYTEASDELLEDSAISLETLLATLYRGATTWYEEHAFVNGTGAGQPLGVIIAGATFVQARAAAGAIGIVDIINMLEHFHGSNPVWLISQSALPSLMQLNGPAANASYVFMPSARDGMPGTLFGYPVIYNEHCPLLGSRGDIGLYDFKMYLIGDRQATTIDSSKHYKFQYDITSWRAVHRVDGQPWLSQPIYLQDGTTQVSPFVVLDAATGS